ncbi:hypothetical protein B0H14DRAFT_3447660 [Mycena olivaceomarginata]|nr:hypothetical protein B0H14DRAFT_3447660 [Mycena olivaceomarginata]
MAQLNTSEQFTHMRLFREYLWLSDAFISGSWVEAATKKNTTLSFPASLSPGRAVHPHLTLASGSGAVYHGREAWETGRGWWEG